jgi:peroxiredoxin
MFNNNRYADLFPEVELDIVRKANQDKTPIKPLVSGETLPSFHIHKKNIIGRADFLRTLNGSLPVAQLLDRPLVLAFHSIYWNDYGTRRLEQLQEVYADIRVAGANLLVASSENEVSLSQLPFATIFDQHQHIAKKAGIYSTTDPIWDRVAGIEADVAVPAVYVLTPSLKIVYASTDTWFENGLPASELIAAVYEASREETHSIAI